MNKIGYVCVTSINLKNLLKIIVLFMFIQAFTEPIAGKPKCWRGAIDSPCPFWTMPLINTDLIHSNVDRVKQGLQN